jgi:hypothetical protein
MWRTWVSIEETSGTSSLYEFALTLAAAFLVFLFLAAGFHGHRTLRRKRIKHKLPAALANPMDLPRSGKQ